MKKTDGWLVHLSFFTRMMRRCLGSSVFENTRHASAITKGTTKKIGLECNVKCRTVKLRIVHNRPKKEEKIAPIPRWLIENSINSNVDRRQGN